MKGNFSSNYVFNCYTVCIYSVLREEFMIGEHLNQTQHKWACVQFIAEVSLIANCKSDDLKIALSIIADLASRETDKEEDKIFYKAQ